MASLSRGLCQSRGGACSARRNSPLGRARENEWHEVGRLLPDDSSGMTCMSAEGKRFTLDTNIVVYSVDNKAGWRHLLAAEIVDRAVERERYLMLQSVSEFYAAVTRKGIVPVTEAAAQATDWLEIFPSTATSVSAVRRALQDASARRISYWDALLAATAAEAGCAVVLTEDLTAGFDLGGCRIHHPFDATAQLSVGTRHLLGIE
jgi:predicted nucleic acid-binding protein